MATPEHAIRTYFQKLGLEPEIADIYLALHTHGPQTISALSRTSGVERTRIYRLLDRLMESNLIEVETRQARGIIKPAPIANLRILISQKEQELKSLQDELELIQQVLARNSLSSPAARVQFYEGQEGIKQMLWNILQSKTEILCILRENLHANTSSKFFEQWVQHCNQAHSHFRVIYSKAFVQAQPNQYATNNKEPKNWNSRHIDQAVFDISHNQIIYNDVVAYYEWTDQGVFGLEIYNRSIANTQRHFFEMLWPQAQPHKA